jgi:uncharacterized protein (DUF302 family)
MLTTVTYAGAGAAAAGFQHSAVSPLSFADTVSAVRLAIKAADLWVLDEVDPTGLLHRGGYIIHPVRQILFFHPRLLARIIAADQAAVMEAPLKFVPMAQPGGAVLLRWFDPAPLFARYGNPDLTAMGQELAATARAIAQHALRLPAETAPAAF